MKTISFALVAGAIGLSLASAGPASAAGVKITPLGSHEGEFCKFDRAMVFEDPDGSRIEVNYVPGKGVLAKDAGFNPGADYQ